MNNGALDPSTIRYCHRRCRHPSEASLEIKLRWGLLHPQVRLVSCEKAASAGIALGREKAGRTASSWKVRAEPWGVRPW